MGGVVASLCFTHWGCLWRVSRKEGEKCQGAKRPGINRKKGIKEKGEKKEKRKVWAPGVMF